MRWIPLVLLLVLKLYAAKVVNEAVYERDDRVDIMLSFDAPYTGKIIQKRDGNDTLLVLKNCSIDKIKIKPIESPILQKMQLLPYKGDLLVKLTSDEDFTLQASKTVDNYGLRLRIKPKEINPKEELNDLVINDDTKAITTKDDSSFYSSFMKVILVLTLLIALLYIVKYFLQNRVTNLGGGWLFSEKENSTAKGFTKKEKSKIRVVEQKFLDPKNRVVLINFRGREYLLLLGESNILLDDYKSAQKSQELKFEGYLKENEEALKEFITQGTKLASYKDMAAKEH